MTLQDFMEPIKQMSPGLGQIPTGNKSENPKESDKIKDIGVHSLTNAIYTMQFTNLHH